MGREVDSIVIQWAMGYRPFSPTVIKNTRKHVCDFCGNPHSKKVARLHSTQVDKDLFSCLECNATSILLDPTQRSEMMAAVFLIPESLCNDSRFKEAEKEADRIREFGVTPPAVLKTKIETVEHWLSCGRGKGWKIIPDLIAQYKERGTLTVKQIEVLDKFNKSCQKEH